LLPSLAPPCHRNYSQLVLHSFAKTNPLITALLNWLGVSDIADLIDYLFTLMPKSEKKTARKKVPRVPRKPKAKAVRHQPPPSASAPPQPQRKRLPPPPGSTKRLLRAARPPPRIETHSFSTPTIRRKLQCGSILTMTTEDAPSAVTALNMNRVFELQTLPNGNLRVRYNLPIADVASADLTIETFGAALLANNAIATSPTYVSTLLLNPMVMNGVQYTASYGAAFNTLLVPNSPHVGLQALSYSRYRALSLGFSYQPQGQTTQSTPATLGESRLRFCYTSDPTHPILGFLGYRGTGTIDYSLLCETPTSIQFAEWNAWKLDVANAPSDWLYINQPRVAPGMSDFSSGNVALIRETYFGAATCFDSYSASTGSPSDRVIMPHGMLWMNGEFEFSDPSPLLMTYIPPALRSMPYLTASSLAQSVAPDAESKEERKTPIDIPDIEDLCTPDVISPPHYRQLPSSAPGGKSYSPRVKVSSLKSTGR
jgi:hypothetical protein